MQKTFVLLALLAPCILRAQQATVFSSTTAVGKTSAAQSVTVPLTASKAIGSIKALSQGIANAEFSVSDAGTCTGTVTESCTLSVTFQPKYPGLRKGAINVLASDGTLLGQAAVSATATGPLAVLSPGIINTVAGDGDWIYRQDGVLATGAPIFLPTAIVEDPAGNLFLSDSNNNRLRRVDAKTGLISTIAGNGSPGFSGDGSAATAAMISAPAGIVLDGAGNIYFVDSGNQCVRRVDAVTGIITTVAGTGGAQGFSGDTALATTAKLSLPEGLAMDPAGDLYIADTGNNAIRRVDAATGIITTLAGGPSSAALNGPWGVTVGNDNLVYVADLNSNRVLKINAAGTIVVVSGTGARGFSGDGGTASAAVLNAPAALAIDPAGNLYIADSGNNRVREITSKDGNINTITGSSSEQFLGDGGSETLAAFYGPYSLFFDLNGNLLIADMFHNRVRKISAAAIALQYDTIRVSKTSAPQAELVLNDGNADLHFSSLALTNAALDAATTTCMVSPDGTQNPTASGASCNLGVEFAPTTVGDLIYGYVTVNSDAANSPDLITLSGQVLTVNPTSVALTSNNNPSLLGASVTFAAIVSSTDTTLGGTVTFLDGSSTLCNAVAITGTSATCTTSALTLGQHNITASYTGDSDNASSVSAALSQVVMQPSTLALTASPNPAIVTNSVVLSVTASAATGTPTGTVSFYDGNTAIGAATLNSGVASFSTSTLAAGTHNLTAQYTGDSTNAAATSNALSEVINLGPTATMLASSNSNATVGSSVTFTASVNSTASLPVSGSVKFTDTTSTGTVTLGTATIASGLATFTTASLTPGTHSIIASYGGDSENATSTSAALAQIIQQIATTTTLSADTNPISAGGTVQLTAKVALAANATADGTITGTVTFSDGATTLGTASVDSTGTATLLVRTLTVGAHTLTATYGGNTNYAASTSAGLAETVNSTTTTTSLSAAGTGAIAGKAVVLTASVTSKTDIPTGSVTFYDGVTNLGQSTLNAQGVATLSLTTLAVGSHNITAVYAGDSNYNTSTSNSLSQLITIGTLTLTLSGPGSAVNVGTAATFTVSVDTNGVAPTGTLTLLDGKTVIGTRVLSASGTFTFSSTTLALGTHSITASYSGDADNAAATSAPISLVIQQAPTTTSLSSSANPVTLAQSLTLTATVTSVGPSITGSISFYDGSTLLGSSTLSAAGAATLSVSTLTTGTHNLTAVYSGDTNHAVSTSPAVAQRVVQAVQIGLTSSANPSVAGASVTFTIKLAGTASLTPSGTVNLLDGQALLATLTLDGTGSATYTTKTLAVGTHNLTATYAGDTNFASGTSNLLTETVASANTQIALTASANPATYGSAITLQAVVKSNGGAAAGNITFTDGATSLGTAVLDATGTATLTISTLAPGTHNIIANYAGDSSATGSVSSPLAVVVKQTTTIALASSANPTSTLSSITFTATITNAGKTVPTGTVTFTDGATQLGTATVDATGKATFTVTSLISGTHNILASYAGDGADFTATSAALTQVISLRPTTTTLTATTDPSNDQQQILIAVVRWTGSVTPTGTVTFTNGTTTVGSVAVDSTGVATLTINVGNNTESIVATYAGDTNYSGSASAATSVGSGVATQFTMALSPSSMTLVSKQHSTATLTIGSVQNFADTLSFGCLGLPQAATCTFSKTSAALAANGTTSVQVTIDTGNPLGAGGVASNTHTTPSSLLLCFLPGMAFVGFGLWKSRKRARFLTLMLLLACGGMATALTGCGGITINSTPAGTYKFQVTALGTGTGISESQTMTLTVTQ